ncbi:MAG: hypothetical protein H0U76_13980 [Ktedonobacteraceae bacterium]|nr:hypothetical protein [Ktedonobacteraceae bacterium]
MHRHTSRKKQCILTDIGFIAEFSKKPSEQEIEALVSHLRRSTDREVSQDLYHAMNPEDYWLPDSVCSLHISMRVKPCRESVGIEGDLDDISDDAVADDEIPQEAIERFREGRVAIEHRNGHLVGGNWASEYTEHPMTWEEFDQDKA